MSKIIAGGKRGDVLAVASLFGIALIFLVVLLIALPLLARVDPVGPNVMKHRLREAYCRPRVHKRIECLQDCADDQGNDYKARACEQLPAHEPDEQDQQRLESGLYDKSPCARSCESNWKTHSLWCASGIGKARLDAVDACIFEGATLALFDWKEARCRAKCPASVADESSYLTSADSCMVLCLMGTLVENPSPHDVRQLARGLEKESDYSIGERIALFREPPVPAEFERIRRECRLEHTRGVYTETLESKRVKERAFRDCVRARLDALPK